MASKDTIGGRQELAGACRAIGLLLAQPVEESAAVVAELATVNPWLEQAAREVAALPLDRWQAEHTRLFVCGFPHTACPPFESQYRHGCLDGPASHEVEDIYRRAGPRAARALAKFLYNLGYTTGEFGKNHSATTLRRCRLRTDSRNIGAGSITSTRCSR